jgi:16S rRNA (guanine527-N7)-methyltransferase
MTMANRDQNRRLLALARRYRLTDDAPAKLEAFVDALVGDPFAPTAVRDLDRALDDHLADSLVALELKEVRLARAVVDLGAGAGVPGLPLAIALPADFVLVESNARKCAFIQRAVAACEIANATVVCARAESFTDGLERFDLVTARALAPLPVVAEYAAPLLHVGGTLVIWRGRRNPEEEAVGAQAGAQLGLEAREPVHVSPYEGAQDRHLQLMLKVRSTPPGFPRRPGLARKRPLGQTGR